ncbi:MAG: hypothetical protein BWX84_02350 [Verrucomicrobia bacterium ADurb.Bin118]|nr:MAG: hypothetical protein BWX84_02350 [Verrucomicrobia bacterium ADurb.Bin118]
MKQRLLRPQMQIQLARLPRRQPRQVRGRGRGVRRHKKRVCHRDTGRNVIVVAVFPPRIVGDNDVRTVAPDLLGHIIDGALAALGDVVGAVQTSGPLPRAIGPPIPGQINLVRVGIGGQRAGGNILEPEEQRFVTETVNPRGFAQFLLAREHHLGPAPVAAGHGKQQGRRADNKVVIRHRSPEENPFVVRMRVDEQHRDFVRRRLPIVRARRQCHDQPPDHPDKRHAGDP